MDLLKLDIPLRFIEGTLGAPSWRDILFGLENELVDPAAATQLAEEFLRERRSEGNVEELSRLASGHYGESAVPDVRAVVTRREAAGDDALTIKRWLCLVMAWIYENRSDIEDPLGMVELVYADFDYPEELASLVRYMPESAVPDDGQDPESRLMRRWADYVERCRRELHPGNSTR